MRRTVLILSVLFVLALQPASPSLASNPVQAALPAGARLLAAVAIPAAAHHFAVAYQTRRLHLGVVWTSPAGPGLVWTRKLPAVPIWLTTPGPPVLFQALVPSGDTPAQALLAYTVRGSSVSSAIADQPSGGVSGDEGISIHQLRFSVRARDVGHVGSVRYRIVTRYAWSAPYYQQVQTVHVPDYPAGQYPRPSGTVHTAWGNVTLIRLEIADTEQLRETGLMYRKSLDPDSGMIFVWQQPVRDGFWMENTYVPLSIAFLAPTGRIQEIQDLAPLTTALHTPSEPYQYAIEVNQAFFASHGIQVGDRVELHLSR